MTQCGFIAIIGAPNAGKSTLTNALVGHKVSIVTHKAQTTRRRVLGIRTIGDSQLVFIDTPGIFQAQKVFDKKLVDAAQQGLLDADFCLVVVDATHRRHTAMEAVLQQLPSNHPPLILVLNKVDLIDKKKLLPLAASLNEKAKFEEIFMVSARTQSGVEDLLARLAKRAAPGPWHYPEDQLSNLSDRQLASEIVREKLFTYMHDELPYSLTVATESWEETSKGGVIISLVIYIEKDSHKGMVLGKGGLAIKRVGQEARLELTDLLGLPVHLKLFVKVKEMWTKHPESYAELGLDFGE